MFGAQARIRDLVAMTRWGSGCTSVQAAVLLVVILVPVSITGRPQALLSLRDAGPAHQIEDATPAAAPPGPQFRGSSTGPCYSPRRGCAGSGVTNNNREQERARPCARTTSLSGSLPRGPIESPKENRMSHDFDEQAYRAEMAEADNRLNDEMFGSCYNPTPQPRSAVVPQVQTGAIIASPPPPTNTDEIATGPVMGQVITLPPPPPALNVSTAEQAAPSLVPPTSGPTVPICIAPQEEPQLSLTVLQDAGSSRIAARVDGTMAEQMGRIVETFTTEHALTLASTPDLGFIPGTFRNRVADVAHLLKLTAVMWTQVDGTQVDHEQITRRFAGYAHVAWYGATAEDPMPRWRVLMPLREPVSPGEYDKLIQGVSGVLRPCTVREMCQPVRLPVFGPTSCVVANSALPAYDAKADLAPQADLDTKTFESFDVHRFGDISDAAFDRMTRRALGDEIPLSVPWKGLENALPGGGLWPGMTVEVGGTGVGKTQWALQACDHAAAHGFPVIYMGLELDNTDVVARIAGIWADIFWSRLSIGADLGEVHKARATIVPRHAHTPLHIMEASPYELTPANLSRLCKAMHREYRWLLQDDDGEPTRPMMMVLDFLQIVGPTGDAPNEPLRERIQKNAYAARTIARDLDAVVMLVSSSAREHYETLRGGRFVPEVKVDPKTGKKTTTNNLVEQSPEMLVGTGKESGEIEYSSDHLHVFLIEPSRSPIKPTQKGRVVVSMAVAKIRAGRSGYVTFEWDGNQYYDYPVSKLPPGATYFDGQGQVCVVPAKPASPGPSTASQGAAKGSPKAVGSPDATSTSSKPAKPKADAPTVPETDDYDPDKDPLL